MRFTEQCFLLGHHDVFGTCWNPEHFLFLQHGEKDPLAMADRWLALLPRALFSDPCHKSLACNRFLYCDTGITVRAGLVHC